MEENKCLIVRRLDTREEVSRVEIAYPTERKIERVMMGMLINMGDDFFIDDSEFDYLYDDDERTREAK